MFDMVTKNELKISPRMRLPHDILQWPHITLTKESNSFEGARDPAVLLSAVCHSLWNLPPSRAEARSLLVPGTPIFGPLLTPLYVIFLFLVDYSPTDLACIIASGLAVGVFLFCLSKAYQYGQVSVAYPIARSFPILVVTWVLFLWGVTPSAVGMAGILLVVVGCFVYPWEF